MKNIFKPNFISGKNHESGQVVLILVLITVVGITIGLSLISRTITDVKISSQLEESNRAFSAAEAGIETALRSTKTAATANGTINLQGADAAYSVQQVGGTTDLFELPLTTTAKIQTVWLIGHIDDSHIDFAHPSFRPVDTLEICWGTSDPKTDDLKPALSVTLLYQQTSDTTFVTKRLSFDPYAGRTATNNFTVAQEGSFCGGSYRYHTLLIPSNPAPGGFQAAANDILIAFMLQPVYNDTGIAVQPQIGAGGTALPVQGKEIISSGKSDTGLVRKIVVNQGFAVLPEIFNYSYCSY